MPHYELKTSVWVPRNCSNVFELFSDAFNLESLTPPFLRFSVITPAPIEMSCGSLIDYSLSLHGLPIRWRTEITSWDPPVRFQDSQVRGPYSLWVHTHTFEDADGGTLMHDVVRYAVLGGRFVHWLLVKRDLLQIFEYRQQQLPNLLGLDASSCRFQPIEIGRASDNTGNRADPSTIGKE
jgi:ligand-binding SRPBCC domain-containing protein